MRFSFHLASFVPRRVVRTIYERLYCRAIGSKGGQILETKGYGSYFSRWNKKWWKNSNTFKRVKLKFMSLSIPDTHFSVFVELDDAYRITRWMRESSYDTTTAVINSDLIESRRGVRKKILDYREKLGPRDSAWNPRAAGKISLNVARTESAASLIGTYSRERRNCRIPTRKNGERGRASAGERRRKLAAMQITAASSGGGTSPVLHRARTSSSTAI